MRICESGSNLRRDRGTRHLLAQLFTPSLLGILIMLGIPACDSDETRTVIVIDAPSSIQPKIAHLRVALRSDEDTGSEDDYESPDWPVRYYVRPRGGDASREFSLSAEAKDGSDASLGELTVRAGFVEGKTRYATFMWKSCSSPGSTEFELKPAELATSEDTVTAKVCLVEVPAERDEVDGTGGTSGTAGDAPMKPKPDAGGNGGTGGSKTGGDGEKDPQPEDEPDAGDTIEVVCGDGTKAPSEACDTDIAEGEPGACPSTCVADPTEKCQMARLVGDGCQQRCEYTTIIEATDDDGCCPSGHNSLSDNDCEPQCGNNVVEPAWSKDGREKKAEDCDPCNEAVLCPNPCEKLASSCSAVCEPVTACMNDDRCCPDACNEGNDSDCRVEPSGMCGDGSVNPAAGETCEPGSDVPCPTRCDDTQTTDPCTRIVLIGQPSQCNVACVRIDIETANATESDGCCPNGANAISDIDCRATCDNGVLEPGETCDGNCPDTDSDCDDGNPCTVDRILDTDGMKCTRRCDHSQTVRPNADTADMCCPAGATPATDADCHTTNLLAGVLFDATLAESTREAGHPRENLTDEDDNTRWISESRSPVTLTADLGDVYTLKQLEIVWAGDTIYEYEIAMSSGDQPQNEETRTVIFRGMTLGSKKETRVYRYSPPPGESDFLETPRGRFLYIVGRSRWSSATTMLWGNSIWEIRAYGSK